MKRTKEESERTREELLNSAVQIFSEKGVARATLNEIARGAGVTRGAVYWHFQNKVEMFDALHESMHRPFFETAFSGLDKQHPDPIEQLRNLWVKVFQDLEEDERRKQSLMLFMRKCSYSGDLAPYKEQHRLKEEESILLFQDYFDEMKSTGRLPSTIDSELLTEGMFCFMKGLLFEYLDDPKRYDLKKKVPTLIELFFKAVKV